MITWPKILSFVELSHEIRFLTRSLSNLVEISLGHVITREGPLFWSNKAEMRTLASDHVTKLSQFCWHFDWKLLSDPAETVVFSKRVNFFVVSSRFYVIWSERRIFSYVRLASLLFRNYYEVSSKHDFICPGKSMIIFSQGFWVWKSIRKIVECQTVLLNFGSLHYFFCSLNYLKCTYFVGNVNMAFYGKTW